MSTNFSLRGLNRNPNVTRINGIAVSVAAPADGEGLLYDGNQFVKTAITAITPGNVAGNKQFDGSLTFSGGVTFRDGGLQQAGNFVFPTTRITHTEVAPGANIAAIAAGNSVEQTVALTGFSEIPVVQLMPISATTNTSVTVTIRALSATSLTYVVRNVGTNVINNVVVWRYANSVSLP